MQDSRILSTQPLTLSPGDGDSRLGEPPAAPAQTPPPMFDGCNVGVILRTVLFVQCTISVVVMFGAAGVTEWAMRLAWLTIGALPATLAWLLVTCALKHVLARRGLHAQWIAGLALGALAGLFACAQVWLVSPEGGLSWWASAVAGGALSAVLMAGLTWRARGRAPAATTARLSELQARIRPHFLFNTLNSAIALVRQDPARAERVLEDLSELFRHVLSEPGEAVTLAQEVTMAQRYLDIEQVRFGPRLRVRWQLDPGADQARVPPLLLQPLVENAVKHGVEPSTDGADITVLTERRGDRVRVRVINTVPAPHAPSQGLGMALANVRQRLLLLHDVQASFVSGARDGRYEVRLELPA